MYPDPLDPPEWCEACSQELARGRHYCPADEWAVPEPDLWVARYALEYGDVNTDGTMN